MILHNIIYYNCDVCNLERFSQWMLQVTNNITKPMNEKTSHDANNLNIFHIHKRNNIYTINAPAKQKNQKDDQHFVFIKYEILHLGSNLFMLTILKIKTFIRFLRYLWHYKSKLCM